MHAVISVRVLTGREQYIELGVSTNQRINQSTNQSLFSGVSQGSILGPLLFSVF